MAILKVARLGHPVLRLVAEPVPLDAIGSPDLQALIDDMLETMDEYDGAGLAAPQVHASIRLVIYGVEHTPRYPDAPAIASTVLINPTITPLVKTQEEGWEGCLSLPDLHGMVPRFTKVQVDAWGREGEKLHFVADDFHARVIQHECDHLDGLVYVDRMRTLDTLAFGREFERYHRDDASDE